MTKQSNEIEEFLFETWQLFDDYISSHNRIYQRVVEFKSRNAKLLKQFEEKKNTVQQNGNSNKDDIVSISAINRGSFIMEHDDSASPSSSVSTMITAISELPKSRRGNAPKRPRTLENALDYNEDLDEIINVIYEADTSLEAKENDAKKRRKNTKFQSVAKWNARKETAVKKKFSIKECKIKVSRLSDQTISELTNKSTSEANSIMTEEEVDDAEDEQPVVTSEAAKVPAEESFAHSEESDAESEEFDMISAASEANESSGSTATEDSDENFLPAKPPTRAYARKKTNKY